MREWPITRLDELIDVKHGFAFKGHEITTDKTECVLVTPGNFAIGGGWKDSKKYLRGYPPNEYKFSSGDLVVTMTDLSKETDTLGYSAKIPNDGRIYAHNQRVGRVLVKEGNPDFLYWLMRTREYQWHCVASASGTSVMHTSPSRIKEFEFNCPPLDEQECIAAVLSSLDDKIDLLKRQNKTLEGMAEALFRKWFIEEAQDDWEEVPLGEFIEIHDNKRIPKSSMERAEMKDGILFPYYGAAQIMDFVNDFIFDFDSILVGEDGSVIDDDGYAIMQTAFDKYWVNNHAHVLTPIRGFNLFGLWSYFKTNPIRHAVTGAVQPKLNQKNLKALLFRLPNEDALSKYAEATNDLWDKRKVNYSAVQQLERTRDTLLPKLMSGEVRVQMD